MSFRTLALPAKPLPIWLLSLCVPVSFAITAWIYYPALQQSGTPDSNGYTPTTHLVGSFIFAALLTAIVGTVTFLALLRYPGGASIWSWDRNRPLISIIATGCCLIASALLVGNILALLQVGLPWYELIWLPYYLLCLCWLLVIRAAAIAPRPCRT